MRSLPIFIALQFFSLLASAALPAGLDQWRGWVRDKHPAIDCPRIATQLDQTRCLWPGRLVLSVGDSGGSFTQSWAVYGKGWVPLPGDREHWPLDVTINGRAASVLEHDNKPMLMLEPGNYSVRGSFSWAELPQSLGMPTGVGLLEVTRGGRPLAQPPLDNGRLWLKRQEQEQQPGAGNSVSAEVFRKVEDDIPRTVETVLRLSVAGKPRELLLGRFLLPDAEVLHFTSPLPARIEDDGRVRVQVRAGQWDLRLRARLVGDTNSFRMQRLGDAWPVQEIWTFAARQELRRVKVSGAASVDPSQLDLPEDFGGLPTYLLEPERELKLEQQYRGDATPAANELALRKTIWLDFSGPGATVRDNISGAMHQGWRLEAQPAVALGRVEVGGEPQLVTRLGKEGSPGVEIRDPEVNLDAVSRVERRGDLSATGWQSDFKRVSAALQLPPGWKLWHAGGPDRVDDSWLSSWNLWNIFLGLLIVGSVFRLLDARWAALALAVVALTYHEAPSPVLYLIPLLVALALLRVLGAGRLRTWVTRTGFLFALALIAVVLGFAVEQIRRGIYPQLEFVEERASAYFEVAPPPQEARSELQEVVVTAQKVAPASDMAYRSEAPRKRYQPTANVQTGPGLPNWGWRQVELEWSGPVTAQQPLTLYVTGPWLTRLLKFIEVMLAAALAAGVLIALWRARTPPSGESAPLQAAAAASALVVLLFAGFVSAPQAQAQEYPPQYLLTELEKRLTRAPDCVPDCAALEAADVRIAGNQLLVRLRVAAGAAVGVPMPVLDGWQLRSVSVDGAAADALLREQRQLLLPLSPGRHDIVLEGAVSGDDLNLQFALKPHHIAVSAADWNVFGVDGHRLTANTLQLQKRERSAQQDALLSAPAKPFVTIERSIEMDIDWLVTTTVRRVAPEQGAINLSVPLLPGESIISDGLEARDGQVAISLGSSQDELTWRSLLKPQAQWRLSAPDSRQWVEHWRIAAAPRWHVSGAGLAPIKTGADEDGAVLQWRPWPGESIIVNAVQPAPVSGATTTVENARVEFVPGKRSADLTLSMSVNSSVGGDYRVQLQEPAALTSVMLNGVDIAQSRSDDKIVLPLSPGENKIEIKWQLQRGVSALTRTPALRFDTAANNVQLTLNMLYDRWPLWLSGPSLGPAMLYWGVLVVIVGVACALGALVKRFNLGIPLRTWEWLLLGIGMSTISAAGSIVVVLWFFALEWRRRGMPATRFRYNALQVGIVLLTLIAAISLFSTIPQSLLSVPDMQVVGNGSHNYLYQWYQDRSAQELPQALVFSVPLWIYRIAMLLWSLWLVFALLRWIKWGWQGFSSGALWLPKPPHAPKAGATQPEAVPAPPRED